MFTSENKFKLIALSLALTLFGGTVGAYSMRSFTNAPAQPIVKNQVEKTSVPSQNSSQTQTANNPQVQPTNISQPQQITSTTTVQLPDQFVEGQTYQLVPVTTTQSPLVTNTRNVSTVRNVSSRTSSRRNVSSQRSYYTYSEAAQKNPSFWNRHRDLLTVGIGTGLGAAIGGIAGGGKGAGIGALAGGTGSALYTYGIRKR